MVDVRRLLLDFRPRPRSPLWRGDTPWAGVILALLALAPQTVSAQTAIRRLTTIEALHEYAGYFHMQNVLVRGEFVERGNELVLTADAFDIRLMNPETARSGPVEVRGQVIDVGRLDQDDPRLRGYVERRGDREWPRPGTELVLRVTEAAEAPVAATPSIRAVALEPWKFEGQSITILGNFRGRNLFGDLPAAPGRSRDDFVLAGAEGAIWVTGKRPEGDGFDLDVERRIDTNKWLEVTGTLTRCNGLVCLEATKMALAKAPEAVVAAEPAEDIPPTPPPPIEVVFSIPTPEATDVPTTSTVRIQFSKGLRESTIEGRVRATYQNAGPSDPPLSFTTTYDGATRALQLTFDQPLEPFSSVVVELLEGMTAFDGAPVKPWRLTFSVGNR